MNVRAQAPTIAVLFLAVALVACPQRTPEMKYKVEPESITRQGTSLALDIRRASAARWEVALTISGRPTEPLDSESFQLEIVDTAGNRLAATLGWESSLIEAGGSMSKTTTGVLLVPDSAAALDLLRVQWHGESCDFRLIPLETHDDPLD